MAKVPPAAPFRFVATEKSGEVSALLMRPDDARWLLVLAHGAGAGMRHAFMDKAEINTQIDLAQKMIRWNHLGSIATSFGITWPVRKTALHGLALDPESWCSQIGQSGHRKG